MLKVHLNNCDIAKAAILLTKYNMEGSITSKAITISGIVEEELAEELLRDFEPIGFTNFDANLKTISYSSVSRGQVYLCDFGSIHGSEQAYMRPAIVIQNNGNEHKSTTIVIPCTSKGKYNSHSHLSFDWSNEIMKDWDPNSFSFVRSTALADQITTIDKSRLKRYLGTLTDDFMESQLEPIIRNSLNIERQDDNQNLNETTED